MQRRMHARYILRFLAETTAQYAGQIMFPAGRTFGASDLFSMSVMISL